MPRKSSSSLPEDDDLPMPPPRSRRGMRSQPDDDGGDALDMPEREPIAYSNRKMAELEATMAARLKGKPKFPYPLELNENYQPYWLELVNSFPVDHFTPGDIPLMKLYVRCAHDIDRCNQMIDEEGDVINGPKGPVPNPRVKVRQISENHLMTLATKFRAQPASRTNTDNFKNRQGKAQTAAHAAQATVDDGDDLLAGGGRLQ